MAEALRLFFLGFYAIGVMVLVVRVLPLAFRSAPAERRAEGINLYLPFFLLPVGFLIPPAAMLTRAGEINAGWSAVRLIGLLLGVYAAVILPWSASTLGRFLVPQARVSRDHELVVEGRSASCAIRPIRVTWRSGLAAPSLRSTSFSSCSGPSMCSAQRYSRA